MFAEVLISPPIITLSVVTNVSIATFESGSKASILSNKLSLIWLDNLSGCPSETDSEVNKFFILKI